MLILKRKKFLFLVSLTSASFLLVFYFLTKIETFERMRAKDKAAKNLTVLYLSSHQGTIDEIVYAFKIKKINLHIGNLNNYPAYDILKHWYFVNEEIANKYIVAGNVKHLCNTYDVIMIGDTIPMGWPFYLSAESVCRNVKIVLQITQRYNYEVNETALYDNLMRNLTSFKNVYWLPNNPYELFLLRNNSIHPPSERTFLIRPYGVSYHIPEFKVQMKKTLIYSQLCVEFLKDFLIRNRVPTSLYSFYSSQSYMGILLLYILVVHI